MQQGQYSAILLGMDLHLAKRRDLAPVFPDPSYSQRNAASLTGERRAWAA